MRLGDTQPLEYTRGVGQYPQNHRTHPRLQRAPPPVPPKTPALALLLSHADAGSSTARRGAGALRYRSVVAEASGLPEAIRFLHLLKPLGVEAGMADASPGTSATDSGQLVPASPSQEVGVIVPDTQNSPGGKGGVSLSVRDGSICAANPVLLRRSPLTNLLGQQARLPHPGSFAS